MQRVIISTNNMRFYYAVTGYLKEKGVPFMSFRLGEPVPTRNSVLITTEEEAALMEHPRIFYHDNPITAARMAIQGMKSGKRYREIIIGIDPGKAIGIAVTGDGGILSASVLSSVEEVREELLFYTGYYTAERFLIRIGNGDQTVRDRITAEIWPLGLRMEMVREQDVRKDEKSANAFARNRREASDIAAAIGIAAMEGEVIEHEPKIRPTDGEIREIQRRSRIASNGRLTISRTVARRVAKGEMEMDEAIEEQGG